MEQLGTLPLVLAVVFLELAIGGAFVVWALDRTRQAPAGFLKLTATVDAAGGAFALALAPLLPRGALAERLRLQAGATDALAQAIPILLVLLVAQLITTFLPFRPLRAVVGAVTLGVGGLTLLAAAVIRPTEGPGQDVFGLLVLPLGAISLGGVTAAMLLGHWYLVTPKLSPEPLQRAAIIVTAAMVLQIAVVAVTLYRGQLVGVFETSLGIAMAIRIAVGLLMGLGLVVAAWWTARMNTQSSTGLLYVALGTVLAGEVAARVVYYLTGYAV